MAPVNSKTLWQRNLASATLVLLLIPLSAAVPWQQQLPPHPEYQVKAAFIYNFTGFVEWPESAFDGPNAPLVIGVYGKNPFNKYLVDIVRNESVDGHPIEVRNIDDVNDFAECHILFLNPGQKENIRELLSLAEQHPVLTVSDHPDFDRAGGIIRLYTDQNRVRLRINLNAAQQANLRISSKLLKVAEITEQKP